MSIKVILNALLQFRRVVDSSPVPETAQTQTQLSWGPLIYAYVTLIQRDAISHTDVGFVKSLTWAPVISNFHAAGDRRFIGARTALDRPVGDPY